MKHLITLILLTGLSLNCGGFKVDVGIDDADLDTLTEAAESLFGDRDSDTDGTDTDNHDQDVETVQGETFIGTFDKWADTCDDYALIDNPRVYESATQVIFYENDVVDLAADIFEADGTLDLTVDGGFGQDDLTCVCEVKSDKSIQCSCESDSADCAVIWGLL